jgi:hypothetical protein
MGALFDASPFLDSSALLPTVWLLDQPKVRRRSVDLPTVTASVTLGQKDNVVSASTIVLKGSRLQTFAMLLHTFAVDLC